MVPILDAERELYRNLRALGESRWKAFMIAISHPAPRLGAKAAENLREIEKVSKNIQENVPSDPMDRGGSGG